MFSCTFFGVWQIELDLQSIGTSPGLKSGLWTYILNLNYVCMDSDRLWDTHWSTWYHINPLKVVGGWVVGVVVAQNSDSPESKNGPFPFGLDSQRLGLLVLGLGTWT